MRRITLSSTLVVLFCLGCFLAPGAWMIVSLPSTYIAQFCVIATVLVSLGCASVGLLVVCKPSRQAVIVFGLTVAAILIALLTNAFPFQQFFYDIYGEMPGYLWLTYPVTFLIAASLPLTKDTRKGLMAICAVGSVLILTGCIERYYTAWMSVFGSVAYAPVALIPIPILMLGIAAATSSKAWWWRLGAVLATVGIVLFSYGLIGIFSAVVALGALGAFAPKLLGGRRNGVLRCIRVCGAFLLMAAIGGVLFLSIPLLSNRVVSLKQAQSFEQTLGSRIEMWHGAQDMFVARPWTGYGPGGYRFNAIRFLPTQIFSRIESLGDDPVAFSPPSPHSLLWEILTRLGIVGFALLSIGAVLWVRTLKSTHGEPQDAHSLRLSCAIAAFAFCAVTVVTPFHFASGLIGALCAGIALAPLGGVRDCSSSDAGLSRHSVWHVASFVVCCLLLVTCAYMTINLQRTTAEVSSANEDLLRLQQITRVLPMHPFLERRIVECSLLVADSAQESNTQLQRAMDAPGYVSGYGPNLVRFAQIGLDNLEYFHSNDQTVVSEMLERAQHLMPLTPPLQNEQRRLEKHP